MSDTAKTERKNPITVEQLQDGTYIFHGRSIQITKDKNAALEPFGMKLFNYGFQVMIFPSDEQAELIRKTNGCARVVRKDYLEKRIELYKKEKKTLTVNDYKKNILPELKAEKPFLKEADKFALESVIENVDNAYKRFFERGFGFPKFASKYKPNGNKYTTKFTNGNIEIGHDRMIPFIKLPKIGRVPFAIPDGMKFSSLCPKGTRITSATVIKDGNNYLVSLQMERVIEKYHSR